VRYRVAAHLRARDAGKTRQQDYDDTFGPMCHATSRSDFSFLAQADMRSDGHNVCCQGSSEQGRMERRRPLLIHRRTQGLLPSALDALNRGGSRRAGCNSHDPISRSDGIEHRFVRRRDLIESAVYRAYDDPCVALFWSDTC
jgi:hypothetical protein